VGIRYPIPYLLLSSQNPQEDQRFRQHRRSPELPRSANPPSISNLVLLKEGSSSKGDRARSCRLRYSLWLTNTGPHPRPVPTSPLSAKILSVISKAPFYASNQYLHNDLAVLLVYDVAGSFYKQFNLNIQTTNPLIKGSTNIPGNPRKKLKR